MFRALLCPSSGEQNRVLLCMKFCTGCAVCSCVELCAQNKTVYYCVWSSALVEPAVVVWSCVHTAYGPDYINSNTSRAFLTFRCKSPDHSRSSLRKPRHALECYGLWSPAKPTTIIGICRLISSKFLVLLHILGFSYILNSHTVVLWLCFFVCLTFWRLMSTMVVVPHS